MPSFLKQGSASLLVLLILALLTHRSVALSTSRETEEESEVNSIALGHWSEVSHPMTGPLYSVAMVSADDGWAVGQNGTILHWNGDAWEEFGSPTTETLLSVSLVSATDGWAMGQNGTILHWNGDFWMGGSGTTTSSLRDVSMISADDGWAVGCSVCVNSSCGVILHWDGASWHMWQEPFSPYCMGSIAMLSTDDGWIGGYRDSWYVEQDYSVMLQWNGTGWGVHTTWPDTVAYINSIAMVSGDDGWAVGFQRYYSGDYSGIIKHWDGDSWGSVASPVSDILYSVDMISADEGWAVGAAGSILHWDGASWQSVPSPTNSSLFSVDMGSDTGGWAVGGTYGGEGVIVRYWVPSEWIYLPMALKNFAR